MGREKHFAFALLHQTLLTDFVIILSMLHFKLLCTPFIASLSSDLKHAANCMPYCGPINNYRIPAFCTQTFHRSENKTLTTIFRIRLHCHLIELFPISGLSLIYICKLEHLSWGTKRL